MNGGQANGVITFGRGSQNFARTASFTPGTMTSISLHRSAVTTTAVGDVVFGVNVAEQLLKYTTGVGIVALNEPTLAGTHRHTQSVTVLVPVIVHVARLAPVKETLATAVTNNVARLNDTPLTVQALGVREVTVALAAVTEHPVMAKGAVGVGTHASVVNGNVKHSTSETKTQSYTLSTRIHSSVTSFGNNGIGQFTGVDWVVDTGIPLTVVEAITVTVPKVPDAVIVAVKFPELSVIVGFGVMDTEPIPATEEVKDTVVPGTGVPEQVTVPRIPKVHGSSGVMSKVMLGMMQSVQLISGRLGFTGITVVLYPTIKLDGTVADAHPAVKN